MATSSGRRLILASLFDISHPGDDDVLSRRCGWCHVRRLWNGNDVNQWRCEVDNLNQRFDFEQADDAWFTVGGQPLQPLCSG